MYTVHEMSVATRWAQEDGTVINLWFEEWWMDPDGDGNAPSVLQWASQFEVWGNYELSDGEMLQGWHMDDNKWDWKKLDFVPTVPADL